jgi:hypothetical protein
MSKRIRTTEPALKTIRDTSAYLPRVEPGDVEAALGAEVSAERLEDVLGEIAVREQLRCKKKWAAKSGGD